MWFRRMFRRRREPPPLLLPSLERLGELVERVVALLDGVELAPEPASRKPAPREEIVLQQHNPGPAADGWVAFISSPDGYRLLERGGRPPARAAVLELEGDTHVVLRLGPSPLPGDGRRCAFVEKEGTARRGANLRPVKEESQIEDMRAAIRGDRERAEQARERSSENVRALIESPAEDVTPQPEAQRQPSRGLLGRLLGQ